MDEFTKLGGYLVQGQPELAHDNTLSGNGLNASPLGLSESVSEANALVHSNSGTWNGVSAKLDTTAFSDVSGTFLTAHQDLSDYQTTAGMTAYANSADVTGTAQYGLTTAGWSEITGGGGTTYTSPSGTILINGSTLEATKSAIDYSEGFLSASIFEYQIPIPESNNVDYYEFNLPGRKDVTLEYRYWSDYTQSYITQTQSVANYNEEDVITRCSYWSADYYGDTGMSGNLVSIMAVPPNNVTAISAFGRVPAVVELALKSDLAATTNTVSANSGAWGGSALPISAGPGVKVSLQNNTLVFENDETVLWSGNGTSAVTASEPISGFKYIKLFHNAYIEELDTSKLSQNAEIRFWHIYGTDSQSTFKDAMVQCFIDNYTDITIGSAKSLNYAFTATATTPNTVINNDQYARNIITKVVGINRIAGN